VVKNLIGCKLCALRSGRTGPPTDTPFWHRVLASFVQGVQLSSAEREYYCARCLALLDAYGKHRWLPPFDAPKVAGGTAPRQLPKTVRTPARRNR
jgi:hypothetical protein